VESSSLFQPMRDDQEVTAEDQSKVMVIPKAFLTWRFFVIMYLCQVSQGWKILLSGAVKGGLAEEFRTAKLLTPT
jgi:hypothetical protein